MGSVLLIKLTSIFPSQIIEIPIAPWGFGRLGSEHEQEIYCALEGFEDEAGDLPFRQSRSGAETRVRCGGAGIEWNEIDGS